MSLVKVVRWKLFNRSSEMVPERVPMRVKGAIVLLKNLKRDQYQDSKRRLLLKN